MDPTCQTCWILNISVCLESWEMSFGPAPLGFWMWSANSMITGDTTATLCDVSCTLFWVLQPMWLSWKKTFHSSTSEGVLGTLKADQTHWQFFPVGLSWSKMIERNAIDVMPFLQLIGNNMKKLQPKQHGIHGCCQCFIAWQQWSTSHFQIFK